MNMMARWNRGDGFLPVTLRGVDDLFQSLLGHLTTDWSPELMVDNGALPRLEVENGKEAVTAKVPLPGIKPENLDIEVEGDMLTIRAKREMEVKPDETKRYVRRERSYEEFEESVKLPAAVKGNETTARYHDGILTITLPHDTEEKSRTHVVKVN